LEGMITPGARFFLSRVHYYISHDGKEGGADYHRLRRAAVLPIFPAAPYSSSWIFMHHHNM
jgi:hypothetical protein